MQIRKAIRRDLLLILSHFGPALHGKFFFLLCQVLSQGVVVWKNQGMRTAGAWAYSIQIKCLEVGGKTRQMA